MSDAIPEDLRELLSQCWEYVAKDRPTINEIVEILEETPEMISPYLEAPVASIPQEGGGSELVSMPWAADRASAAPQGPAPQQTQPQLTYSQNGTHGGAGDGAPPKRAKTTKSLTSFTDGQHPNQPRSPLGRNFSHPSTTSTTTTSQDNCFLETPASLESQHPKMSLDKGGRFFLRSNSEDVSDSNSPPPTPTAQITSFFNSAVNSAAQALRKQPSKNNSFGFSSTPSPSASGLTTPMTLTPSKHPIHPQFHQEHPALRHHPPFHRDSESGAGGDVCISPPDLFPLRPLRNSHGQETESFPGGHVTPQLMASPTAAAPMPYSRNNPPCDPSSASHGSSFPPELSRNVPPAFYGYVIVLLDMFSSCLGNLAYHA